MDAERKCPACGKRLPTNAPQGLCPECLIHAGYPTGAAPAPEPPDASRGAAFAPPSLEELAALFPQLQILQLLGHGGMGAVYKARQPSLDRLVALKILPPQPESDIGFAERFNREARALAKLSHPNIVAVYDFGVAGKLHYFLMEYVEGGNLRELQEGGKFSPREALRIIPQICEALQYAHDEGIVHRDIKPENVMLDKRGRVKITDFGLAKITGLDPGKARLTGVRDVMGTPHYMAPEQIEHPQDVDHRADIYSLGVVFYEMLTGELPLGRFAPPSRKVRVDVRLDEVVLHTLEKEPTRRYQHASEVQTDLEEIASGREAAAETLPKKTRVILWPSSQMERAVLICRWTARVFSVLLLAFYGIAITAEGLPPIGSQPSGVQLNFVALALMLLGFVLGWKQEGMAAISITAGWVLWNSVEPVPRLNLFQTPIPVAVLYAFCWWATRGRRTKTALAWAGILTLAFGCGRVFIPANVFVRGTISDVNRGWPIENAEFYLESKHPGKATRWPNGRSRSNGEFDLYVGWYLEGTSLRITAPGYLTVITNLGPRALGQRIVARNFTLRPETIGFAPDKVPPVVIATIPESGSTDVDPSLTELRVTFSHAMAEKSWSWVKLGSESYPETTGEPRFLPGQQTCVLPVRLRPGRTYAVWLNVDDFRNFQSADRVPSMPYLLIFKTRD